MSKLDDAKARLQVGISQFLDRVVGVVPMHEMLSWGTKEAAARAYLAGGPSQIDAAMLQAEATARGAEISEVAGKIVAKANAYRLLISAASGIRQAAEDRLTATDNPAEFERIVDEALALLAGMVKP